MPRSKLFSTVIVWLSVSSKVDALHSAYKINKTASRHTNGTKSARTGLRVQGLIDIDGAGKGASINTAYDFV